MKVSNILAEKSHKLIAIAPDTSIRRAIAIMAKERVGALVIEDADRRLLGVVAEHAVIDGLARRGPHLLELSVHEIMMADGPTISPDDSVLVAMRLMTERRARHLPVIVDSAIVGLISVGDVLKSRLAEKTEEVSVLRDIAGIRLAAA